MSYRLSVLDNGITVVTDCMPGANTAHAEVYIRVGSRDEPAELGGVSHFVEHMLFRGSSNNHGDDIIAGVEMLGGDINAETQQDTTSYGIDVLSENINEALPILLDMVVNPAFEACDVSVERKIILQEIHQIDLDCDETMRQSLLSLSCGRTAFARPLAGTFAKVSSMSRDSIAKWHNDHYKGSSIVVSVAGNIKHADIVATVEREMGHLPKGRRVTRRAVKFVKSVSWLTTAMPSASMRIIIPSPHKNLRERMLGNLYSNHIGTGLSSRLYKRLCLENALSYTADCGHDIYEKESFLDITYDAAADERMVEATRIVLEEIKNAALNINEESLERSANIEMKSTLAHFDSPESLSQYNGASVCYMGRGKKKNELIKIINSIKVEDLRAYAANITKAGMMAVGGYGPKCGEKHFAKINKMIDEF